MFFFFFQAEDGIRDGHVTGVQTCALPISGTSMMRAVLEVLAGDSEAAERVLRPSLEILVEAGERGFYSTELGYLAEAVYRQGRYDEAERLALEAAEAGGPDDVETQRLSLGVRAKVLARRGETAEAERLDLAEVLQLAGRPREAATAAREAAELYAAKGAEAGVRAAEARAAELEAESSSP